MRIEDALRKLRLMRQVRPENGSSLNEAKNATHLSQKLMAKFSIDEDEMIRRTASWSSSPSTLEYWQNLLNEFGLKLRSFANRGTATIGDQQHLLVIKLDTGEWCVEQKSPQGWKETMRRIGLNSLREYLRNQMPRRYSYAPAVDQDNSTRW
jgi:hypothetical protein